MIIIFIAYILQLISLILSPVYTFHPALTPIAAQGMLHSHSFTGKKAREKLGYAPIVSREEALRRTISYFSAQHYRGKKKD